MISSVDGNNLNKKTMNKKEIADLIKEAEHQQEGFHRVSGKMSQDLINALKAAINYTHSCTELRDKEPTLVYNGRDRFGKEIWLNKDKT